MTKKKARDSKKKNFRVGMMFFDQAHAASVICAQTAYKGLVQPSEAYLYRECEQEGLDAPVLFTEENFKDVRRVRSDKTITLAKPIDAGVDGLFRVGSKVYKMSEGGVPPSDIVRFVYGQLNSLCTSRSIRRVMRPYGHHLWLVTTHQKERFFQMVDKGSVDFLSHPIPDLDILGYAFKNYEQRTFVDDFYQMTNYCAEYEKVRDRLRAVISNPVDLEFDAIDVFVGYLFDGGILKIDAIGVDLQSLSVLPESLSIHCMPSWTKMLIETVVADLGWNAPFRVEILCSAMHESHLGRFVPPTGDRLVFDCTSEREVCERYGCRIACTSGGSFFEFIDACTNPNPQPLSPLWKEKQDEPSSRPSKKKKKKKTNKLVASTTLAVNEKGEQGAEQEPESVLDFLLSAESGCDVVNELKRCIAPAQLQPFLDSNVTTSIKTVEAKLPMSVCMFLRASLPKTVIEQFLCQDAVSDKST